MNKLYKTGEPDEIAIIISIIDPAGMNIKNRLLECGLFERHGDFSFEGQTVYRHKNKNAKIYTIGRDTIYAENIDREINAEIFIFAARHEAASGHPTLSTHAPGNFETAGAGGIAANLCAAPAFLLKKTLIELKRRELPGYNVTMEATHHGPFLEKPALFIEIGSAAAEWNDISAGMTIAGAINDLIIFSAGAAEKETWINTAAIGGTHYCAAFNKYTLDSNYAIGHVCPKYRCGSLNENMIRQISEKTMPEAKIFLIDHKGLNSLMRENIIKIIKKLGFEYVRV